MGRRYSDEGGNALMSDYDRIIENQSLSNPLLFQSAAPPLGAPAAAAAAPASDGGYVQPNPLAVPPPRPLSQMPLEQQLAWHQYQSDSLRQENANQSSLIDIKARARQEEFSSKAQRQADDVISRVGELDATDVPGYILKRTQLLKENPFAMGDPRVQALLTPLDDAHKNSRELTEAERVHKQGMEDDLVKVRLNQAYTQAAKLGPQVLGEFNASVGTDPQAAISKVAELGALQERQNAITQLQDLGLPPERIAQFTGPGGEFLTTAAQAAIERETKNLSGQGVDQKRREDMYLSLLKRRSETIDNGNAEDWTPDMENYLKNVEADVFKRSAPAVAQEEAGSLGAHYVPYEYQPPAPPGAAGAPVDPAVAAGAPVAPVPVVVPKPSGGAWEGGGVPIEAAPAVQGEQLARGGAWSMGRPAVAGPNVPSSVPDASVRNAWNQGSGETGSGQTGAWDMGGVAVPIPPDPSVDLTGRSGLQRDLSNFLSGPGFVPSKVPARNQVYPVQPPGPEVVAPGPPQAAGVQPVAPTTLAQSGAAVVEKMRAAKAEAEAVAAKKQAAQTVVPEAVNPKTGKKVRKINGKWVEV